MISYSSRIHASFFPVSSHLNLMNLNNNLEYVLNLIHADRDFFDEYIGSKDQSRYFKISQVKKRGGTRTVYEPKGDKLQSIHKAISEELKLYRPKVHDAAHGFLKDRSNVTNAQLHLGARFVLNLDIKSFFDSIRTCDVEKAFLRLGFNEEVADALSKFCTVNGVLPQGVNGSPDISNHCFYDYDVLLSKYSSKYGIIYTRYADDMSFSGRLRTDETPFKASEAISIIEDDSNFVVAKEKTKIQKRGANQYVTGLTIFDSEIPRVSKKFKRRLRLELYIISKIGIDQFIINLNKLPDPPDDNSLEFKIWREELDELATDKLAQIEGRINYLNGVEPIVATRMRPLLDAIYESRKESHKNIEKLSKNPSDL